MSVRESYYTLMATQVLATSTLRLRDKGYSSHRPENHPAKTIPRELAAFLKHLESGNLAVRSTQACVHICLLDPSKSTTYGIYTSQYKKTEFLISHLLALIIGTRSSTISWYENRRLRRKYLHSCSEPSPSREYHPKIIPLFDSPSTLKAICVVKSWLPITNHGNA